VTVAGIRVPRKDAWQFGVIKTAADGVAIEEFLEKPADPPGLADSPDEVFASMGNYVFSADVLIDALEQDAANPASRKDMGGDIIPMLVGQGRACVYDFKDNVVPGATDRDRDYWRDVGTIDSYFTSNMEVRARVPALDLYNRTWRIRTAQRDYPPARFVRAGESYPAAEVDDSLICEGSIIASARVREVVLGYDCFVHAGAHVEDSVILSGCDIGAGARLTRVLLDKNCKIEPGVTIGEDPDADRERFPFVTDSGIVVVPKGTLVPARGPIVLANDVSELLQNEPELRAQLRPGIYAISTHGRHSYASAGPRYKRYGPEALAAAAEPGAVDDDE
jgi:glucose-1-phosphate adenylyltransferase